jgi:hypothetical protein
VLMQVITLTVRTQHTLITLYTSQAKTRR